MKGKMIVIRADGSGDTTELTAVPKLETLQIAVGGYIETVPYFDTYEGAPCVAFCNEEGKLDGSRFNRDASNAWLKAMHPSTHGDVLFGDVVILQGDDAFMAGI